MNHSRMCDCTAPLFVLPHQQEINMVFIAILLAFIIMGVVNSYIVPALNHSAIKNSTISSWQLLVSKASAAHVYYVKRTARCRSGRSPSRFSSADESFHRQRSMSSASFHEKPMREIQRIRSWNSFHN